MFKRIDFLKTVPTVGVPRFEENTSFGEGRTFLAGRESKSQIRLEMAAAIGAQLPASPLGENLAWYKLAERVGFEPTVRFPAHTLSKRAP
jgi:hypothetical protein